MISLAGIPDSIKIKLEVDTTELDTAIEKLERFIKLQKQSMALPCGCISSDVSKNTRNTIPTSPINPTSHNNVELQLVKNGVVINRIKADEGSNERMIRFTIKNDN